MKAAPVRAAFFVPEDLLNGGQVRHKDGGQALQRDGGQAGFLISRRDRKDAE